MQRWLWTALWLAAVSASPLPHEVDSEQTRKLLGSSVVTSVSVIMDHGNGTKTYLTNPQHADKRPQVVGTPGTLLAPDRYEFYSFGEDGELVKKLMTLDQIQSLIASGDDLDPLPVYYPQPLVDSSQSEEGVHKVLESVQNVLRGELQSAKPPPKVPMPLPDDSWSILLPGLLNSDLDFKGPHIPVKNEANAQSFSNNLHNSNFSTRPSQINQPFSTTLKYTLPQRPSSPAPIQNTTKITSSIPPPETSTIKKSPSDIKFSTTYNTPAPFIKTTGHLVTKPQHQKPLSTTKRPIETKKPVTIEYTQIKLSSNSTKFNSSHKPTTSIKRPVGYQDPHPGTKITDSKKPVAEKKKPSGIPTITHYLPVSSSSSPHNTTNKVTTPSSQESTTQRQKITYTTKDPIKVSMTRRPSISYNTVNQKMSNSTTKKPMTTQSKPPVTAYHKTTTYQKNTTPRSTQKIQKPTSAPQVLLTKPPMKISTVPTQQTPPALSKEPNTPNLTTTSESDDQSTVYQIISTTSKPVHSIPQNTIDDKKPNGPQLSNNLIGQSSNIVHSKLKPTNTLQSLIASSNSSTVEKQPQAPMTASTPLSERITTFSYTSKLTASGEIVTSTVASLLLSQNTTPKYNESGTSRPTSNNITTKKTPIISTTPKFNDTPTNITTETTMKKVSLSEQHSTFSTQTSKEQTTNTPAFKPTTYHPQNFKGNSKTSTTQQGISTTTQSIISSTSPILQYLKQSTTTQSIPLTTVSNLSANASNANPQATPLPTASLVTKSSAESTLEGSTIGMSTVGTTFVTSDPGQGDSTTFVTEQMPLEEIPQKIYESLKDQVNGAPDIMTTIMSENLQTTTGKLDHTYTTTDSDENFSSVGLVDKLTTTMEDTTSTTASPGGINLKIQNTTENLATDKENGNKNVSLQIPDQEPLQGSASMPIEQKHEQSSTSSSTVTETSTLTPTDFTTNSSENSNTETTTFVDSTTIYKDQILQEGISAVTSILLDEAQRQQAMKEALLVSSVSNNQSRETEEPTTENEPIATTIQDLTETQAQKQNQSDKEQMKSEVRLNEDAELPEKPTSELPESTTVTEKSKSSVKGTIKETQNFINISENKPPQVLPTKESKLNPNSDHDHLSNNRKPENTHTYIDGSMMPRTTASPDISSTSDRFKIADFEKSVPKPLSSFAKKPIYQPLESLQPPAAIELHPAPYESMGLEASTAFLGEDVRRFADLCNELAFRMWTSITGKGQIASRSLVMSPFAVTSLLAMVFLGARGPTSGQMNDVLRLDDMVTFNPHQVLQNVTESVISAKNHGVATAAFVRELYSDKGKGKILDFYKERVQQYYQGHVEEVNFAIVGDIIRRRTNLLVKRQTLGKVQEYLKGSSLNMRPPLAAFSANIFQTDCEHGSTDGRDGEMYFVVRPSTRQRRLVPVPAVVWRSGFLAGYEPSLDATSVCLGADSVVSTILILPGQQGQVAPGDGLARLEQRLIETSYRRGGWSRLLRSLMPRPGLELQVPRFSHRSVLNITGALQRMGLRDLFNMRADLRGLNGLSNDLHLSDMLQVNTFSTCGEETIGARHHVETYPASPQRMGRDETEYYPQKDFENIFGDVPLSIRPRQARLPDNPRLRFDRPFLYMVRHNPSGMILHMGRFNPRLLP